MTWNVFGCVSAILCLCPERSWRALCPAVPWATSRCVSPETTRRRRRRRRAPPRQHDPDTSNTTWCSTASTSRTSCSNRTVAFMSAGKTDTDDNNKFSCTFYLNLNSPWVTLLYIYPSVHLARLCHVLALQCERTAELLTRSSFLHSGCLCMPGLFLSDRCVSLKPWIYF